VAARIERCCEYRRIEPRVARVEHDIDPLVVREGGDRSRVRGVDRLRYESRICASIDRAGRALEVEVGDDDPLENIGFRGRARDRGPDPAGSEHENAHRLTLRSMRWSAAILGGAPTAARGTRSRCSPSPPRSTTTTR